MLDGWTALSVDTRIIFDVLFFWQTLIKLFVPITLFLNPSKTLYSDYFDHSFRKKGYEGLSKIYNYLTKKNNPDEILSSSI